MDGTPVTDDLEKLKPLNEEEIIGGKMEKGNTSRSSNSLCTRSRVAPGWTLQESLILVNEINAIENDCGDTLPSFQKWMLIVENCNALEVNRSFNQCRSKWNSLLDEYKRIKQWEAESALAGHYWSLQGYRRKEFGLPETLHYELFEAIDNYVKAQKDEMGTDLDSDLEAKAVRLEFFAKTGIKKRKRSVMAVKHDIKERAKPQRHGISDKIKECSIEEKVEHSRCRVDDRLMMDKIEAEEKEQIMAAKIHENVELINAILEGNLVEDVDHGLADVNNAETQTDFRRRQGDKLITCLANLADTLNQLCDLVQE